jgi:hypothetical protein
VLWSFGYTNGRLSLQRQQQRYHRPSATRPAPLPLQETLHDSSIHLSMDSLAHDCAKVATPHGVSPLPPKRLLTLYSPQDSATLHQFQLPGFRMQRSFVSGISACSVLHRCSLSNATAHAPFCSTNHFPFSLNTVLHLEAIVSQCSPDGWVDHLFDGL